MAIIGRGIDDLIIDRMVTALREFSTVQAAQDTTAAFSVVRDQLWPPAQSQLPLVNLWLSGLVPEGNGSSKAQGQETMTVHADLYTRGLNEETNDNDQVAMSRLYYLKEQVKYALFALIRYDFGFDPGIIGKKRWPRFELFQNDLKMPEEAVVGGRWTIEVEYFWQPEDVAGTDLDEIRVTQDMRAAWGAKYTYGG